VFKYLTDIIVSGLANKDGLEGEKDESAISPHQQVSTHVVNPLTR
jgi:hypothetical protein